MAYQAKTRLGRAVNEFEETAIAVMLGLMTVITFVNVIARYVFNSNILWQLEATVFLFAWLVLFGVSYCVKITAHLGVDVIVNEVGPKTRKIMGLASVAVCLAFCLLMLKGGWDYWHRFATRAAFLEVNDIPMPGFLQFLSELTNDGEPYEKIPRYIPYLILPVSMALLTFRFLEAGWRIVTDEADRVIASHEAEELVEEASELAARNESDVLVLDEGLASRAPLILTSPTPPAAPPAVSQPASPPVAASASSASPTAAPPQEGPAKPVRLDGLVRRDTPRSAKDAAGPVISAKPDIGRPADADTGDAPKSSAAEKAAKPTAKRSAPPAERGAAPKSDAAAPRTNDASSGATGGEPTQGEDAGAKPGGSARKSRGRSRSSSGGARSRGKPRKPKGPRGDGSGSGKE